jgi:phage shock protein E
MNKHWRKLALAIALGLAACGGEQPTAPAVDAAAHQEPVEVARVTQMDPAAVKARLEAGENIFLLDVRRPDELVDEGQIAGAVNIPIDELESRLAEVPKDQPIVTYCKVGGRASRAAETLRKAGYDQPIETGGITAWKEAGLEVVQPDAR